MKRSAFISDIIFTFFTSFLCALVLFRFLGVRVIMANLLAILCGILVAAAFAAAKQNKRKLFFLKKSDETLKEKLSLHLAALSDDDKTRFFIERLSEQDTPARRYGTLHVSTDDAIYFLKFTLSPVNADEILTISRCSTDKKKILLCNRLENDAGLLCERLRIEVLTIERVFLFLKERNALPEEYLPKAPAPEKHRRLRLWFSRKNAKRFLVGGGLILVTAFVSPFPYYYLVFGLALTASAILVRIFGRE